MLDHGTGSATNGITNVSSHANGTHPAQNASDERSPFVLGRFNIDDPRPMKIIIIGAGFSGICAGIRFLQRMENVEVVIYDKNAGVGGTWYTNRYPGLACDIPSHCYQYTFFPNTQWSAAYAPGPEILAYLENVVTTYKLEPYIKLEHEMVGARWDDDKGKWIVKIKAPATHTANVDSPPQLANGVGVQNQSPHHVEFEDSADLLFTGLGGLSRWNWPDIEGLHDFKGTLIHSAKWEVGGGKTWQEDVKDWGDKTVGVIGVGSTALQIVPALQPLVGKVYNYVRNKNWLATPFAGGKLAELLKQSPSPGNYIFTDEEKTSFKDPVYYKQFRQALESELNSVHQSTLRGNAMQQAAREAFKANMLERLAKKPWIADYLIPDFAVACRRLTPGPGYLEALCEDNVEFVPTPIRQVTTTGITLTSDTHHTLDVLICATGYDTTFLYPFPIIGLNSLPLTKKWQSYPSTYLSVCVDEFPNWFFSLGPNSAVGSGSLLALVEAEVEYAVKVGLKMQRERIKRVCVKRDAVVDYGEYVETVYSEKCPSWYKTGKEEGRVVGLWPGSCLHALRALASPRWEDFDYVRLDGERNKLHWLGNGMTWCEENMTGDRAWYLRDENVDVPPAPVRERRR
ncbi:FAD/NAD-binding domain-containing protein [Irpex rosettiformis]|uniref:FAD/NAD-binding domain-containing protein n=1 Tax=Irpex rosettiformis TaxID=378272 RepID=A0ACB8UFV1_9APHY|nr:FAD/NAD-binding domain-containing protein [Irpex rosettiformis]